MNKIFIEQTKYLSFLKYLIPSILSLIFVSFYTTIDGYFASHFINSMALASINIVLPITALSFGLAIMMSIGSGALVGMKLGEGKLNEAHGLFSFIFLCMIILSIIMTILGLIYLDKILYFLGATKTLMPYAKAYGFWTIIFTPMIAIKLFLEHYARIDSSPLVAMIMSILGIIFNIVINYICVNIFDMGIAGAAIGTGLSVSISSMIGIFYFISKHSKLKFKKPTCDFKFLFASIYNGSSEMLTEISTGITTFLFNIFLLKYAGENGIAAMSVITYLFYFFIAFYFGITVGSQPIISFCYGAKNFVKIRQTMKYAFITIIATSIPIFLVSNIFAKEMISIFIIDDKAVLDIAINGLKLFSMCFLLIGINIFISGYFTAIGSGTFSAIISICRAFIFVIILLPMLSKILGLAGIWVTVPIAELLTITLSIIFLILTRHKTTDKNKIIL